MDVRIFGTHMLLSPELWILGVKLSPDPGVTEVQETGYPELGALIVGPSCGKGMHVNTVAHCGIVETILGLFRYQDGGCDSNRSLVH